MSSEQTTGQLAIMASSCLESGLMILVLLRGVLSQDLLSPQLKQEIHDHKADVDSIINYVLNGAGRHEAIRRLENLTDGFGPRSTGSEALEDAIDYLMNNLNQEGFVNVAGEDVIAAKWTRNEESLYMTQPRYHQMALMSLGSSVGTNGVLEREVVVVKDFDELDAKANENADIFKDKIVLYNQDWLTYPKTVLYRTSGAWRAAQYKAAAVLVRSVTDFSIYSPHTGMQSYKHGLPKIPAAAITVEDSNQMQRYYDKGLKIVVKLNMTCENQGNITTRNVVAEMKGSSKPDEVVIFGGHIDSWDVGNGVMDDGAGVAITWQALNILKALNLTPKRTLRAVFWTSEEIGLVGAEQYYERHKEEKDNVSLIMESDYGTFKPYGVGFSGTNTARAIIKEIVHMLETINATGVGDSGESPDTGMWIQAGVPGANLWNANDKYFYFHHSHGDAMTMQDPDDLDLCVIVWTVVAYVVASLEDRLPRLEIVSAASFLTSDRATLSAVAFVSHSILKRLL